MKTPRKKPSVPQSLYKPEHDRLAHNFCLLGATNENLGRAFGVTEKVIEHWIAKHESFAEAVRTGRDVADAKVARSLYERATGYKHPAVKIFYDSNIEQPVVVPYIEHFPPDTAAAFIWLKNRRPLQWRDVQQREISGADGGPIQIAQLQRVIISAAAREPEQLTIDQETEGS